jgi:3-oxoacyl-[acyl-carrier protein] reductase
MDLQVEGRRYLIGGGSRGLGLAVAEVLSAEGAEVVLVSRTEERLAQAAEQLPGTATYVAADLATEEGRQAVFAHVVETGPISGILVNGGGPPAGDVFDITAEQWRAAFDLVIGGPIELIRGLRPHLADPASIAFITSSSNRQLVPGIDTSNVLRPGVAGLVKCLGRELAPAVRVNAIAPGRFDTDRVRELDTIMAERTGKSFDDTRAAFTKSIPAGRYGDPTELARLAAFLLSPVSSFCNGALYQVDGAQTTALP